jgi:3-hydroxybutyryl-CoA dehydrogenase
MQDGHIGLRSGRGSLDYENLDIDAYRRDRLAAFVAMLGQLGLARPPVLEE